MPSQQSRTDKKANQQKHRRGRHLVSLSAERQEGEFSAEMKDKNIDF